MNPRSRYAWPLVAVFIALWLSGCVQVQEVELPSPGDKDSTAPVDILADNLAHDVQILAVDFTWLDSRTKRGQPQVRLSVAVENKGYHPETDLTLTIVIRDNKEQLVTQYVEKIPSLAPGEIVIPVVSSALRQPYATQYHLEVTISTVPGETDLSNNSKTYDIEIDQTN